MALRAPHAALPRRARRLLGVLLRRPPTVCSARRLPRLAGKSRPNFEKPNNFKAKQPRRELGKSISATQHCLKVLQSAPVELPALVSAKEALICTIDNWTMTNQIISCVDSDWAGS